MALLDGVVSTLLGDNQSGSYLADALKNYSNISVPELQELMVQLQQQQSAGTLDPALEQVLSMGDTALAGVSSDPRLRDAQMSALESLAGLASGNPTQGDLAGFELARQNSAAEMQAKNNQVLQEMQQRGQGGSGAELIAKLKNNQSGAQMLQNAQLEQAKAMQAARQQALQQQATLASNVRSQDYSQASDLAKARDAISQFNTANAQATGSRNTAATNTAAQQNLANAQNISNNNTNIMNQQQQINKGAHQTNFNNQLALANAKSGVNNQQAANANQQYANNAGMIGGLLQSGITAAVSDKNEKKNITESGDIQKFLDSLTAFNYDYKNPANGQGQQTGVMAQDLEKTPQGKQMVQETENGKVVDYGKGLGVMMAALAELNDRLNKMENK